MGRRDAIGDTQNVYRLLLRFFGVDPPRRGFRETVFFLVNVLIFFALPRVPEADARRGLTFLLDGRLVDFRRDLLSRLELSAERLVFVTADFDFAGRRRFGLGVSEEAFFNILTSIGVNGRCAPRGNSPNFNGPIATRFNVRTL